MVDFGFFPKKIVTFFCNIKPMISNIMNFLMFINLLYNYIQGGSKTNL